MRFDVLAGPLGTELAIIVDDDDVVVAAGFSDVPWIAELGRVGGPLERGDVGVAAKHWHAYLEGDVNALEQVAVRQSGTVVQEQVWAALRDVPPAHPISYGEMAEMIGRPRAARAVGAACGANRVAPFVPCHRVVAAGGGLGGYGYGLDLKRWFLAHENGAGFAPVMTA